MGDLMLDELYERFADVKRRAEWLEHCGGEVLERELGIAITKKNLLSELIDIRTDQIRQGRD
jgi:hypothetical protein